MKEGKFRSFKKGRKFLLRYDGKMWKNIYPILMQTEISLTSLSYSYPERTKHLPKNPKTPQKNSPSSQNLKTPPKILKPSISPKPFSKPQNPKNKNSPYPKQISSRPPSKPKTQNPSQNLKNSPYPKQISSRPSKPKTQNPSQNQNSLPNKLLPQTNHHNRQQPRSNFTTAE